MADRVVLITGASTGIGAATAHAAVDAGYRVALAARSEDRLTALAGELGGDERALARRCDVTRWEDQEAMVASVLDAFGRIDATFANAGFGARRGFENETPEFWREMVLTNVLGVAYTIRATLPAVRDSSGHYVLTSSVAGRRPLQGSLYSATKHAATALGESLRQELRQMHENFSVRVTLIEPGMTDTPFFDNKPQQALEPEDIASAVLYTLSQPARVDVNEVLIRPVAQPG